MCVCVCVCFVLKIIVATLGEYSLTSAEPARLKATNLLVYVWRETLFAQHRVCMCILYHYGSGEFF